MLLAAWRRAMDKRFFPFGVLLLIMRPPLSLLLGTSRSQLANCLAEAKRLISFPILQRKQRMVLWLTPGIWKRSVFKCAKASWRTLKAGEFLFNFLGFAFGGGSFFNIRGSDGGIYCCRRACIFWSQTSTSFL